MYKGIIQGVVTSVFLIGDKILYFTVKTEDKLDSVPPEFPVYSNRSILLRKGDKVQIYGEIQKGNLKYWEKDIVRMFPDHIFNETLKCGIQKTSKKRTLRKGKFKGTVTSVFLAHGPHGGGFMYFSLKFEKKIYDIPEEIFVDSDGMTILREGDIVHVVGEIYLQSLKFWQVDSFEMRAEHVYNETLNFGF